MLCGITGDGGVGGGEEPVEGDEGSIESWKVWARWWRDIEGLSYVKKTGAYEKQAVFFWEIYTVYEFCWTELKNYSGWETF